MAKRKKRTITRSRTKTRPSFRRKSSNTSGNADLMKVIAGAAIYGGVREKVSNLIAPLTAKIPLGTIADEVVLGTIHYFGAKKVSNPMLKSIFRAGLIVESARIGEAIADGTALNSMKPTTTNNNGSGIF